MTTERNWLIRTTQNQILGPVAKAKVLEFLQKGALGLNDEVASGNGFWFSLKEKDLVEKYIYGDIPQGYNPISESKSVLSKRENPDKTTSLNTAPANKTQVLKTVSVEAAVLPKNEDLEFPDITLVRSAPAAASAPQEEMKLPNQDDLEFPDITIVARPATMTSSQNHGGHATHEVSRPVEVKVRAEEKVSAPVLDDGPVVYPQSDDLEFPDMGEISSSPKEEDLDFQVTVPVSSPSPSPKSSPADEVSSPGPKKGIVDIKNDIDNENTLTLMVETPAPAEQPVRQEAVKKVASVQHQPEKLLHERKVKASAHAKEVVKDLPKDSAKGNQDRSMPEHLKKRNDNYLLYLLAIFVLIILALIFYYYRNILNKPLPV